MTRQKYVDRDERTMLCILLEDEDGANGLTEKWDEVKENVTAEKCASH